MRSERIPLRPDPCIPRAPEASNQAVFSPAWTAVPNLMAENRQRLSKGGTTLGGVSRLELQRMARDELLRLAVQHTSRYRSIVQPAANRPIVLSGHQPVLVHPGVWFKNFVAHHVASQYGATTVHLIVDNDLCRNVHVSLPGGTAKEARREIVALDRSRDPVPFEERQILDPQRFADFPIAAATAVRSLVPEPLVTRIWQDAVQASRDLGNLGLAVARARHQQEAAWGLESLEVPLGEVCDTEPFRRFSLDLLLRFRELHNVYNRERQIFREIHKIRSETHPVPCLQVHDGAWEVPFWIWTSDAPSRTPLFVRAKNSQIELLAGMHPVASLSGGDLELALEQLTTHPDLKLRPRALLTTMFARLLLSDLFVHGIGGGSYDRLTNRLAARLFALQLPDYLITTATTRVVSASTGEMRARIRELSRSIRDLDYHPERYLNKTRDAEVSRCIAKKRDWIERNLPRGERRERHMAITECTEWLRTHVAERRQNCVLEKLALEQRLPGARILESREYPFCIFPESQLRPAFASMLP